MSGSTFSFDRFLVEKCSIKLSNSSSDNLSLLVQFTSPKIPYNVSGFAVSIALNAY